MKTIKVVPGPWMSCSVTRENAGGNLYNACRFEGQQMIESTTTPTHSEELAERLASDLNRLYHQSHKTGVPAEVERLVRS